MIQSVSPATGEVIADVRQGTVEDYRDCVNESSKAWKVWTDIPAPKRGEIVRQIGEALRANLEPLGKLVAMEMGNISIHFVLNLQLNIYLQIEMVWM